MGDNDNVDMDGQTYAEEDGPLSVSRIYRDYGTLDRHVYVNRGILSADLGCASNSQHSGSDSANSWTIQGNRVTSLLPDPRCNNNLGRVQNAISNDVNINGNINTNNTGLQNVLLLRDGSKNGPTYIWEWL
jgi:hypothetical protein